MVAVKANKPSTMHIQSIIIRDRLSEGTDSVRGSFGQQLSISIGVWRLCF
jgi:hypothetical protein